MFLYEASRPWRWTVFDQPDLAILIFSGLLTFAIALVRFIIHLIVYSSSSLHAVAIASIYMSDLANLVMIVSFYIQFRLIKKFLLFNEDSMKQLIEFQFILHLAPVAIIINLLLFGKFTFIWKLSHFRASGYSKMRIFNLMIKQTCHILQREYTRPKLIKTLKS